MWIPKIDTRQSDLFEQWLPYWEWEEVKLNMWGEVKDKKEWLKKAIEFTSNHELYGKWMMEVVKRLPNSCRHNLSKRGDKRSWVGHAAVALALRCPENIVREAWGRLTQDQQDKANQKATEAIQFWMKANA